MGIQGTVLALDPSTGLELWRTVLKGRQFVNVTLQGETIVAATKGEVFALDPATGQILWNNKLSGLGLGEGACNRTARRPRAVPRRWALGREPGSRAGRGRGSPRGFCCSESTPV